MIPLPFAAAFFLYWLGFACGVGAAALVVRQSDRRRTERTRAEMRRFGIVACEKREDCGRPNNHLGPCGNTITVLQ